MIRASARATLCTLWLVVGNIEVYDPVHRVRPASATPTVRIQRNLFKAANAQPLLLYRGLRLPADDGVAEHVLVVEQWLGQEWNQCGFSQRIVFCWSKAILPKMLALSWAQL